MYICVCDLYMYVIYNTYTEDVICICDKSTWYVHAYTYSIHMCYYVYVCGRHVLHTCMYITYMYHCVMCLVAMCYIHVCNIYITLHICDIYV